jgi:hypothetical protein
MKTSSYYDHPDYDRPFMDYHSYRQVVGRLRAEAVSDAISKGVSAATPSRRTLRTFGLAFLVATGAFWAVMLQDPPKTVAADPSTSSQPLSPLGMQVPFDLPTGDYIAH